jgi:uncharacterized protein YjeT (DUF2065 family)
MAWALAVLAGLIGVLSLVSGGLAIFVAGAGRKAFEAALADDSDDGLRARGLVLVERIRSPALRWVVNRRTGAMAGTMAIAVVRDRIATLRRGGVVSVCFGVAAIIAAIFIPGMMA